MDESEEKARRAFHSPGSGYQAGFGKTVTDRVEQSARAAQRREAIAREKLIADERPRRAYSSLAAADIGIVSDVSGDPLPADFLLEAMARVEVHLRVGQWPMAKRAIDEIERQWEARKQAGTEWAGRPMSERLGIHAVTVLPLRLVNAIESVGPATVGAILDGWPDKFVELSNIGTVAIEQIGEMLLGLGLISEGQFLTGVDHYVSRKRKRGGSCITPTRRRLAIEQRTHEGDE